MKLAVFDFDSTLMDGELLEILAGEIGIEKEIKDITNRTMDGELDFFESLRKRVYLLKGLKVDRVNAICKNLPVMPGAKETIFELKKMGYKCVCFSGCFKNAIIHFVNILSLDGEFSNTLHIKDGVLTGYIGGEMMFGESKGDMLFKLQKLFSIDYKDTLVVGDGANDLSMFKYAEKKVAFCAREILKKEANIIIEQKDLRLILDKI